MNATLPRFFWSEYRKRRKKAALITFALFWGTLSILLLMAFGQGMSTQFHVAFSGLGETLIMVYGGQTSLPFEGLPRGDVGVVVQLGYDDLVSRTPPPPQRAGQMEGQGGHVGPKRDFLGLSVQEIGQGSPSRRDHAVGLDAAGVGPVGVGVVMVEVVRHRLYHRPRGLSPPGSVEIGHRLPGHLAGEGRKVSPNLLDVRHRSLESLECGRRGQGRIAGVDVDLFKEESRSKLIRDL